MDIKVKDQIFYRVDSQLAAILTTAFPTVFERVDSTLQPAPRARVQPPGTTVQFGLRETPTTGEWYIFATDNRTILQFRGTTAQLSEHDFWLCGKANKCPPELVLAYRDKRAAYGTLQEKEI